MGRNATASALRSFHQAKSRLRRRRWTIQVARHVDRQRAIDGRPLRAHRERSDLPDELVEDVVGTGARGLNPPGFLASVFSVSYSPILLFCIHVSDLLIFVRLLLS